MKISKFIKKTGKKEGMRPGSVVYVGKKEKIDVNIDLLDYSDKEVTEKSLKTIEEAFSFKQTQTVSWLNITGLHDVSLIEKLGENFELHPLVQEDIVNTAQRPMLEEFDDYIFIALKMLHMDKNNEIIAEHLSIVLGKNFVLSFQEIEEDVFNAVRERIKGPRWRIRKLGSDYLTYALIDSIVDHYFVVLEKLGDKIESIEQELNTNPTPKTQVRIQGMKKELIFLRKSIWPLREVINKFQKTESKLIKKQTQAYISDLYDHTIQVIDTVESLRDIVSGMTDVYLSSISNKMNEVMKTLSIIATIALPLTVISGIYGTNFTTLPGSTYFLGFWAMIIAMVLMIVGMLAYFRKKKWF